MRRPSYSNNAFSNNALNAIRRIKGSLLPSRYNLDAITIKPPVVLVKKKYRWNRNHLSRRKLRLRAGGLRRAETKCEICVGGYFPWPPSCNGRHGRDVSLPRVTVPFNRWLGDGGIVGGVSWVWDSRGSVMGNVLSLQLA